MFVTPSFINKYSSDLDSLIDTLEYSKFVTYLKSFLTDDIIFDSVTSSDGTKIEDGNLTVGTEYNINGSHFGSSSSDVKLSIGGVTLPVSSWTDTKTTFIPDKVHDKDDIVIDAENNKSMSIGSFTILSANNKNAGNSVK